METAMRERMKNFLRSMGKKMGARPLVTFFILLALLFCLIFLSHTLRRPDIQEEGAHASAKSVAVYIPREHTPRLSLPALVEKENIMPVTALAGGVVAQIYAKPGQQVGAGQVIMEVTNDYQSGEAALERARAEEEYRLSRELSDIDEKIEDLEEEQIDDDSTLTNLEEEIALRELRRERKVRESELETSRLSLEITRRNQAALKPKTLISGTLENITVERGDYVTPGTVLATVRGTKGTLTFEAWASAETQLLVDPTKPALLVRGGQNEEVAPNHIASGENEAGLFSLLYAPLGPLETPVTEGTYVELSIPLSTREKDSTLVPIDALFQDGSQAWVLVEREGSAQVHEVHLGSLYGSYAEVTNLPPDARVILNRSVIAGDQVSIR